jgi:hypothetical protein
VCLIIPSGLLRRLSEEVLDPQVALATAVTMPKELAHDFHDATV